MCCMCTCDKRGSSVVGVTSTAEATGSKHQISELPDSGASVWCDASVRSRAYGDPEPETRIIRPFQANWSAKFGLLACSEARGLGSG